MKVVPPASRANHVTIQASEVVIRCSIGMRSHNQLDHLTNFDLGKAQNGLRASGKAEW